MADETKPAPEGDRHEDVQAARAMASDADVQAANTQAAPADAFEAFMQSVSARLRQIESVIGLAEPLVNEAAAVAGIVAPTAEPILSRLPKVEAMAADASAV